MAKSNTKTIKKIQEVGATVNPSGIYYDKIGDRAYVRDMDNKPVYVSAKKAGGEKEMFYAAAGLRNYITKYRKRPDEKAWNMILTRAKNAEKSKEIWEKRYQKKSSELRKPTEEIIIDTPKLSDLDQYQPPARKSKRSPGRKPESFETIVNKAIEKGIISGKSAGFKKRKGKHHAEEKIEELGLNMDPRYITYYPDRNYLVVRITTKFGHQRKSINVNSFNSLEEAFYEADVVRKKILRTGGSQKGVAQKEQLLQKSKASRTERKIRRPIPSEVNPPQKKEDGTHEEVILDEQRSKSKENTSKSKSFFSKIKMWIFG